MVNLAPDAHREDTFRVLVQVTSAGANPWLAVEVCGQGSTWANPTNLPGNVEVVWVEANPWLSRKPQFVILNALMRLFHESFWWPLIRINLRKVWPFGAILWVFNSAFRRRKGNVSLPKLSFLDLTRLRRTQFARSARNPVLARLIYWIYQKAPREFEKSGSRRIRVQFPNSYFLAPARGLLALESVVKIHDFDYLVRTVSTSYLDLDKMVRFICELPKKRVCAGPILELAGFSFVGGSLQILSRDVVEQVLQFSRALRLDVYDDVGLGRLLREKNLADFYHVDEVALREHLATKGDIPDLGLPELSNSWAYRCKVQRVTGEARPVIDLMERLHKEIVSKRVSAHD